MKRRTNHADVGSDTSGDARPSGNRDKPHLQGQPVSGKDERSRRWLLSLYNALSGKNYTNTHRGFADYDNRDRDLPNDEK